MTQKDLEELPTEELKKLNKELEKNLKAVANQMLKKFQR